MRYESQELLDRLAAEYVLGTLRGPARRRFERLCESRVEALRAKHRWENEWLPLTGSLTQVQPSAAVWPNIRRRLFGHGAAALGGRERRSRWLGVAAGMVAVAVIVGLFLWRQPAPLQPLARLGSDPAHVQWQLERRAPLRALTIRVVGPVQALPGKSYELWALPAAGKPVSLGLLPTFGTDEHALSDAQRTALLAADKLAVSVEPAGGSPTGAPTGPVIIVTPLRAAG
jgi:anti-sigma-K factor RskA